MQVITNWQSQQDAYCSWGVFSGARLRFYTASLSEKDPGLRGGNTRLHVAAPDSTG